jgi:hypothetical protein
MVAVMIVSDAVRKLVALSLLVMAASACSPKERVFESVVQLVRRSDVDVDDKGVVTQVDLEFEWDPCPGDQFQVVRGGTEFAACMSKYETGTYLPVNVKQWWDGRGYYRWDVTRVGDCERTIEPDTEGSYEKSQECENVTSFGEQVGFSCRRRPEKRLLQICPWMARH